MCLDFQTFVCQQCSGLHRGFGHKIKSISLSEWSLAEVAKIEEGGNEKAALMWLHRYNKEATTNPEPESSDVEAVREFIRAKFVDKKWFRPLSATPEPAKTHAPAPTAAVAASATASASAAAASSPASGAGGYAAAAPRPVQATQAPMMDLLSGGGSTPVAAAGRPAVAMPDLLDPAPAASMQAEAWTADFSSNAPKAPSTLIGASAGLIDLDFSAAFVPAKASPPMPKEVDTVAAAAPVAEPAEEPAPTQADDGSASMGEKLRQAVLSGSQDDMKRLFDQCSQPAQMKAADPDRVKAFAAFDELFAGGSSGEAQQQDHSSKLEGQAPGVQATATTSHQQQQQPLMQQSQAESEFGGLLEEMTSLGLAASIAPAASSSAPAFPAAAAPAAAAALAAAAASVAAAAPVAAHSSSDVFSPQRLAQLMPQGMAGNLTPGQLEQMSPQDLQQLQMMISSALQARTPQQPAATSMVPSPPPWQTAAVLSQHSSNSTSDIDWAATDTSAQFGELVDMFQQKKT